MTICAIEKETGRENYSEWSARCCLFFAAIYKYINIIIVIAFIRAIHSVYSNKRFSQMRKDIGKYSVPSRLIDNKMIIDHYYYD